jgi:glycosyltransferase involved in cell wall biosynthesis
MRKVSIGLPVYNGDKFLAKSIESILNQTYGDFELIISDNGSTDNTKDICIRYAAKDSRIQYVRNDTNRGAAWNYNHVFHISRSEYFKWVAYDDVCEPDFLRSCLKILENDDSIVLCYTKTVIIDENDNKLLNYVDDLEIYDNSPAKRLNKFIGRKTGECNAIFGLIRSSALARTSLIGNFNASDFNLLAHLSLLGNFYMVPVDLFCRRDHPNTSINANKNSLEIAKWFDPNKRYFIFPRIRQSYEYYNSIFNSNIPLNDKLSSFNVINKMLLRKIPRLAYKLYYRLNNM